MTKIKFPVHEQAGFINELREKVKGYFETNNLDKHGNYTIYIKTVVSFIIYLTPYLLILSGVAYSVASLIVMYMIMGVGMALVGMMVMHDAAHSSYSKNHTINYILSGTLYLLGGFPAAWRHQHNTLHHGYTNIDGMDEDIDPNSLFRFSPNKPLLKVHRYQHIYAWPLYGLMTLAWTTGNDFSRLFRYQKSGADLGNYPFGFIITKLVISKLIYFSLFLVLPMLVVSLPWFYILAGYLIMHLICGFILTIIFQTAHVVPSSLYPLPTGAGMMENNWAIHQLLTTANYAPESRIFSWFIGGLNYQVEHHLFPNICHVHYPKIAGLVRQTAHKYGLPYHVQPTFLAALSSHASMLKRLGREW